MRSPLRRATRGLARWFRMLLVALAAAAGNAAPKYVRHTDDTAQVAEEE
jgi:hypothetical protein